MRRVLFLLLLAGVCAVGAAQDQVATATSNWPAPPTWSPSQAREGVTALAVTSPLPFIGISPCRIADTRGNGFGGAYGPPSLSAGAPRSFTITGQCGIPSQAEAVSLNITATNTQGPGFIKIFPQGGTSPVVSTLNYVAGQTVANAAIVPLGGGGGITVAAGVSGTDLIIDVNGYYAASSAGFNNTFVGDAGNSEVTGTDSVGVGSGALMVLSIGGRDTAIGASALRNNVSGDRNTAVGYSTLLSNIAGSDNTATGFFALEHNIASSNTADGSQALRFNSTGINSTATGYFALQNNDTGCCNTAAGFQALLHNVDGSGNTAVGAHALENLGASGASFNIAIGNNAGVNITGGGENICIGNLGDAADNATLRIGQNQTSTFIAGIATAGVSGAQVMVSPTGQLGIATSSRRYKLDIRGMGAESGALMKLRPVAFRYKPEIDPEGLPQFGLIAEEVARVFPELVVNDSEGRPETVRYHLLVPMLLNELQKDRKAIEDLEARLTAVEARSAGK